MLSLVKAIGVVAVIGVVIIASLFVLDFVDAVEMRDLLQKILLVLSIIALGGIAISFFLKPKA